MAKPCVIFKDDDGGVSVLFPATSCGLTVDQIALKDVPFGKPYKIIDAAELPEKLSTQAAWAINDAELTDGVGADYGAGSNNLFVMPEVSQ